MNILDKPRWEAFKSLIKQDDIIIGKYFDCCKDLLDPDKVERLSKDKNKIAEFLASILYYTNRTIYDRTNRYFNDYLYSHIVSLSSKSLDEEDLDELSNILSIDTVSNLYYLCTKYPKYFSKDFFNANKFFSIDIKALKEVYKEFLQRSYIVKAAFKYDDKVELIEILKANNNKEDNQKIYIPFDALSGIAKDFLSMDFRSTKIPYIKYKIPYIDGVLSYFQDDQFGQILIYLDSDSICSFIEALKEFKDIENKMILKERWSSYVDPDTVRTKTVQVDENNNGFFVIR